MEWRVQEGKKRRNETGEKNRMGVDWELENVAWVFVDLRRQLDRGVGWRHS